MAISLAEKIKISNKLVFIQNQKEKTITLVPR